MKLYMDKSKPVHGYEEGRVDAVDPDLGQGTGLQE